MARLVDVLSIALLAGAGLAFSAGVYALGDRRDLHALWWLVVGALLLRAATDLLRPRAEKRR
jgi:hypothetical protein